LAITWDANTHFIYFSADTLKAYCKINIFVDSLLIKNKMIGVIATLKIQEGKGAEFEAIANQLVEKVNANEEGVVYYDLYKQDDTTYVFLERYKDEAE